MRNEIKRYLADKNKHLAELNRYHQCQLHDLSACCEQCLLGQWLDNQELAGQLLAERGGLKQLFHELTNQQQPHCDAEQPEPIKTIMWQMRSFIILYQRYLYANLTSKAQIGSPDATRDYLRAKLYAKQAEVFSVLFLDNAHQIIHYEELFTGTINGANVYPRVVLQKALSYNAAAIILAHNHPSGVAEPSEADKLITQNLVELMHQVDIRILDHIVIGEGEMVSFAERGLL